MRLREAAIGLLVGCLVMTGTQGAASARAVVLQDVEVMAHRGGPDASYALGAPEESLLLLTEAAQAGMSRIDLDVVYTSDQVAVLQHGDPIGSGSTATCTDQGRAIHTMTWAQLSTVTCGGQPIARLSDVVSLLNQYPKLNAAVEVKSYTGQSESSMQDWMKWTLQTLGGLGTRLNIASFQWRVVASTVKQYAPQADFLALEYGDLMKIGTNNTYSTIRLAQKLGATDFGYNVNSSDAGQLQLIKDLGMGIHVYDLKSDQEFRYAIGNGQTLVGADDPVHVLALIASFKGQRPAPKSYKVTKVARTTVLARSLAGKQRVYPQVFAASGPVPASAQNQLAGIRVSLTLTAKKSGGSFQLVPKNGLIASEAVSVKVRKGTHTYTLYVPAGDAGTLMARSTKYAVKATLAVTGYRKVSY